MYPLLLLSLVLAVHGAPKIDFDGRIVGGRPTTIEEYPYQASLYYLGYFTCGGSIISPNFIVTAAHCTKGTHYYTLYVRVGSNITHEGGQKLGVVEIYQNPKFKTYTLDFDVSVLRVNESIRFGPAAQPIGLAPKDFKLSPGTQVTVTGWGTLTENGELPKELQVVEIPAISNEECQEAYKGLVNITDRMICAREKMGGKDSCQGDSGGPLVVDGLLVGIVSWGYGCAEAEYPGVYSRISELRTFISNVTNI